MPSPFPGIDPYIESQGFSLDYAAPAPSWLNDNDRNWVNELLKSTGK